MDIFESLENLNVSEECFEDIVGLVEEYINELYPATTKNVKKAYDRRVKQHNKNVRAHNDAQNQANKTFNNKRDAELAYQKARTMEGASRRSLVSDLSKDNITPEQALNKQEKVESNQKKLERVIKKLDNAEKKNEEAFDTLHATYDNKKESGDKLKNIERLIKNHLLIKNK